MEFQPMSPDEVQRTMQFLLHQQAQFAADSATSQARIDALGAKTDQMADGLIALTAKTDQVADGLIALTAVVGRVVDTVAQVVGSVSHIADAQKQTLEMFERHLREDHGYRPS